MGSIGDDEAMANDKDIYVYGTRIPVNHFYKNSSIFITTIAMNGILF